MFLECNFFLLKCLGRILKIVKILYANSSKFCQNWQNCPVDPSRKPPNDVINPTFTSCLPAGWWSFGLHCTYGTIAAGPWWCGVATKPRPGVTSKVPSGSSLVHTTTARTFRPLDSRAGTVFSRVLHVCMHIYEGTMKCWWPKYSKRSGGGGRMVATSLLMGFWAPRLVLCSLTDGYG